MRAEWLIPEPLQELAEVTRRFVGEVIVPAEMPFRGGLDGIPHDVVKELQPRARSAGLWCFATPSEYGGMGLSPFGLAVVTEEAVRHTFSMPDPGDGIFGWDPPNILIAGTDAQKERYLIPSVADARPWFVGITEPTGGSDPARAIRTRAERTADGWRLTGHKRFTGRANVAPQGIIYARASDGEREGITAFIVESGLPGATVRSFDVIRDRQSCELVLDGVEIPADAILGEVGSGFALAQKWLVRGRIRIAAACIGVARAAIEMGIARARERVTFGALLASRQAIQWMIADSEVELRAARWLTWEAAWREERGEDARQAASVAKLYATEASYRILDRMIQLHGGDGVTRELPLEHWLRAVRVYRIAEGPSEIHRYLLARDLLGRAAIRELPDSPRG